MPLYAYRCPVCSADEESFLPVAEVDSGAPDCPGHGRMRRHITSAPMISVQAECHFICSATEGDVQVTSHRQRANIMAEHNLIDARELNQTQQIAERKARKARALDEAMANLPPVDLTEYMPAMPV